MADNQELMTLPIDQAIDRYAPQLYDALPEHITVRRFKRILMTAVSINPDLAKCDRRSFCNAAIKCAQDGLMPDGREAALIPYNGIVSYQPMVTGLVKLMTPDILSQSTELVYANDYFEREMGDDPRIVHRPPPLGTDRGDLIGVYCVIRLKTGDTVREVMTKADVEYIRTTFSKNTRADAPWKLHYGEMARKTVLKKAAKRVAWSGDRTNGAFSRNDDGDDDYIPMPETALPPRVTSEDVGPNGPKQPTTKGKGSRSVKQTGPVTETVTETVTEAVVESENPAPPPETAAPAGNGAAATSTADSPGPSDTGEPASPRYSFGDHVGEIFEFEKFDEAVAVYSEFLDAAKNDQKAIATLWENGFNLRSALVNDGHQSVVTLLADQYNRLTQPPAPEPAQPAGNGQTAPAGNGQAAPNSEFHIPFDGARSQAWYKVAAAKLDEMRQAHAPPDSYTRFADQNKETMALLKGPDKPGGPALAFRSLWNLLDKEITYGLNRRP
jgi:phage RecT family recombinase